MCPPLGPSFWDEFRRMQKRFEEIQKRLESMFNKALTKTDLKFREPLADMIESGNELILKIELPGVDKNDIRIKATENTIEVQATRKKEKEIKKKGFYKIERSHLGYRRAFSLPSEIEPRTIKADFTNGILTLRMKKKKKKEKKYEIKI